MMLRPARSLPAVLAFLAATIPVTLRAEDPQAPKADPPAAPAKKFSGAMEYVASISLPEIPGTRLSGDGTYDGMPSVAVAPDGTTWCAWVAYRNHRNDEVVVVSRKGDAASPPQTLTSAPGECIRPVLAAAGGDVWCLWTAAEPDRVASVWFSRRTDGRWSTAARFLPDEARPHLNPEIAASPDGRVAVVYQVHTGKGYDIHLREWDGKAWSGPGCLTDGASDNWDPSTAIDTKGNVHVVWSGFKDGDYDVQWVRLTRLPEPPMPPRRISARGEYDLHPTIAASPDGTVWVAWDVVRVPRHGTSGLTTITGANLHGDEDETHGKRTAWSGVDVRAIDGGAVRVPGRPREEIVAPKGALISHCAYAKIAVGPGGEPWIVYRALRRAVNTAGIGYYWDVLARPFRGGTWGAPARLADGDGYLEEAGVATGPDGIRVAYSTEHRDEHIPGKGAAEPPRRRALRAAIPEPKAGADAEANHNRDFDGEVGWKGDVYLGLIADATGKGPGAAALPAAKDPDDHPVAPRVRAKPYAAAAGGKSYLLLWGDTHRHSNVSRCSQGGEPTPEDLYRYGADIERYDFVALSDHAEDPRLATWDAIDAYWWKQQKLADLYHVPGFMSVLYNFEWSLHFPWGHHNTIFPSRPTVRLDRSLASSGTLEAGWKVLDDKGLKAITIPHTGADPGMGTTWEWQDDRHQRLCEIFQACRGSYEHAGCPREFNNTQNKKGFYWNALEKGYHVGVIASSDHGYGCAYACVYAPANTRDAIWQAMWDRRTYGSTTYGLVLEMRSGDRWMGEEWASKEAPALDVYVKGAAPIRSVEILGRSQVLHAEGSLKEPLNKSEVRLRWTDPDWAAQTKEQWYYVRVIQTDDEIAWSSPVWVRPP